MNRKQKSRKKSIADFRKKFTNKWIIKTNFSLFNEQFPVLKVMEANVPRNIQKGICDISFTKFQRRNKARPPIVVRTKSDSVKVISEVEARRILRMFHEMKKLSISADTTGSHIREDTGEEKRSYDKNHFLSPLFRLMMKYPDKTFNAYQCPVCGSIHIGKVKSDQAP